MVDYTKATGSGGLMMIRDLGSNVEFHIRAGFNSTYINQLRWKRYVNGSWSGLLGPASYPTGRPWKRLDSFKVSGNQNICFRLEGTGTQGLGGPTEFWQTINRATVPPAPSPLGLDQVGHTSARYRFQSNGTGGSPILEWQIGYGKSPTSVQFTKKSSGTSVVDGLSLGERWYFWARGRNAVGWGPWSARLDTRTLAGARVLVSGTWREAVPMVRVAGVWRQAIPFIRVSGAWKDGK